MLHLWGNWWPVLQRTISSTLYNYPRERVLRNAIIWEIHALSNNCMNWWFFYMTHFEMNKSTFRKYIVQSDICPLKSFAFGWALSWSLPEYLFFLWSLHRAVVNSFNGLNLLRIWWALLSDLWFPVCWYLLLIKFAFQQSLRQGFLCRHFIWEGGDSRMGRVRQQGENARMSGSYLSG